MSYTITVPLVKEDPSEKLSVLSFDTIQKTFYLISGINFFKDYDLKLANIKKLMETI